MRILDAALMPESVTAIPPGATGVHESCLRGRQVLNLVREWLEAGVPAKVVLDLLDHMDELADRARKGSL